MYKNLRIVFTILSAICLAAAIPLGIFFGYVGWIAALIGAGIFFFIMLLCKQSQENAEQKTEKIKTAKANNGSNEETDGETEFTPQQKLSKNALSKPPKYRRKNKH